LLLKITRLDKANIVNSHLIFFDLAFLLVWMVTWLFLLSIIRMVQLSRRGLVKVVLLDPIQIQL
jgi:hypothetical protein